jgi:hypothetical protein
MYSIGTDSDAEQRSARVLGQGGPAGADEWPTAKQRTAVEREVTQLLDALAPHRPVPRAGPPPADVRLHRAPGRCVMQAATGAVSVSWFPGHGMDETLGEMQVIEWRGVVSLPGATRRAVGAVAVGQCVFHPVEVGVGAWEWHAADGSLALPTSGLVAHCRRLLPPQDDGAGMVAGGE